ncbi:MAG: sulfatase-like hydrolase/transferase [Lentisphaeria bacterium]|nr:sulfatase-like hydrolase/transferase [Lentisphaeria bacterium]
MNKTAVAEIYRKAVSVLTDPQFYRKYAGELLFAFILVLCYILLRRKYDFLPLASLMAAGAVVLFCCGRAGRCIYLAALGVVTVVERHFIIHYNESFRDIGTQALITLQITSDDEILTYLTMLKTVEFLLPLLFIGGIIFICFRKNGLRKRGRWGLAALPLFGLAVYCTTSQPVRDYFREWASVREVILEREAFSFDGRDISGEEKSLRILVLGESHRQDYFDDCLITENCSPLLFRARTEGRLLNFTDMISMYPQTWYSVFTCLTRRDGLDQATYFPEKGLPTLFREAGYKVHFVTYQPRTPSTTGYDYLIGECDSYTNHYESSGTRLDMGMVPIIRKLAGSNDRKILVIVKMVGVHFKFHTRYPDEFKLYTPTFDDDNFDGYTTGRLELMLNSYRNGMVYSGAFLNELAKVVEESGRSAMMSFISDHGLTLFDDGENPMFGAAKGSYHIPFFFFGNAAYWQSLPAEKRENLARRHSLPMTNRYFFETFASASGVTYPGTRPVLDLTADAVVPAEKRKVWVWKNLTDYDSLK